MVYDVIIIGAGVVGGAVARELSRYRLSVLCLEKEADVCCGTSKANTGIIHSPALIPRGTIKAGMAVRGAACFEQLSRELGFTYQNPGALVLGYSSDDEAVMQGYIDVGLENYREAGIEPPVYRIIRGAEMCKMEPALHPDVHSALYTPDAGRIIPYEYGIACWENAVSNGVELRLNAEVKSLHRDEHWHVATSENEYQAGFIINAAGHGSNSIGQAAGFADGRLSPVKGQYIILKRDGRPDINHILFQIPQKKHKKKGKGILVTRTVYGNTLIGPDARWQDDDSDTSTDMEALGDIISGAMHSVPGLKPADCITTFAGVRPKPEGGDFIIENADNFVHLCGIESPGLTSSPAIAADVLRRLERMGLRLEPRAGFTHRRRAIVKKVLNLGASEVNQRIKLPGGDGQRLVCRCEQVPEARILDAVNRGIPVTTIDGVKRRTRAGAGNCQGGFCGSRVRSLLAEVLGIPESEISQRGSEPKLKRVSPAEVKRRYR